MYRYHLIIVFSLVLFVASCRTQKTVVKKYYVIENPDISQVVAADTVPLFQDYCRLADVEVYPAYASRQIANRNRSNEIQYYQNHEWAVRPEIFLNNLIEDYLENANIFKGVASRYWQLDPKYLFETKVYNLEVMQYSAQLSAHVQLEMTLIDRNLNKVVLRHVADVTQPLERKDLNLAASTISDIFVQELEATILKMKTLSVQ